MEEILFSDFVDEFLLIYRNENAVIIGKHQNAVAEANIPYLYQNEVPLIRRFSGGGTVFHDMGNINFCFITTGEDARVIDFRKYARPVIEFLISLKVSASLSDRNDIIIGGKKVSGNAAHAKGKRVMHHGTLLYNSNLNTLSEGLKVNSDKFHSRAVKSVRSQVTNVIENLDSKLPVEEFTRELVKFIRKEFEVGNDLHLTEDLHQKMIHLAQTKYKTYEWNFGNSPEYSFPVELPVGPDKIGFTAFVKNGLFNRFEFKTDHWMKTQITELTGVQHNFVPVNNFIIQHFIPAVLRDLPSTTYQLELTSYFF